MAYYIAIASSDGERIDRHFGHADTFYIAEVSGETYEIVAKREVKSPCQHGFHDVQEMQAAVSKLQDCRYVLAEAIGQGAENQLNALGIRHLEFEGPIQEAVNRVIAFDSLQQQYHLRKEG